jgi:hypothetical protein
MRRRTNAVLVAAYLAVMLVPLYGFLRGTRGRALDGAYAAPAQPQLDWSGLTSERFQIDFTKWFDDHIGYRGTSVRADNAILLHVFGETRPGSDVKLGKDGVLFQSDDLYFATKYRAGLTPTLEQMDAFAARLARVQATLRASHRALVPVLSPAKTAMFPDAIPPRWDRDVGSPRPTETLVSDAFRAALDRHGVVYVDGFAVLTDPALDRALVWGRGARHWSHYGTCHVMARVAEAYRTLTERPIGAYPCQLEAVAVGPIWHSDYDLYRLLNTHAAPPRGPIPIMAAAPPSKVHRPATLIAGTSFIWMLVRDANRSRVFGHIHASYYAKTLFDWAEDRSTATAWDEPKGVTLDPTTPRFREAMVGKDLYVLDLFEAYLIVGSYAADFLDQLEPTLVP